MRRKQALGSRRASWGGRLQFAVNIWQRFQMPAHGRKGPQRILPRRPTYGAPSCATWNAAIPNSKPRWRRSYRLLQGCALATSLSLVLRCTVGVSSGSISVAELRGRRRQLLLRNRSPSRVAMASPSGRLRPLDIDSSRLLASSPIVEHLGRSESVGFAPGEVQAMAYRVALATARRLRRSATREPR